MPERHDEPSVTRGAVVDLRDPRHMAGNRKVLCSRDHPNKPENSRCFICDEILLGRSAPPSSPLPPPPPPPRVLEGRGR
jgi:hypothetical protein